MDGRVHALFYAALQISYRREKDDENNAPCFLWVQATWPRHTTSVMYTQSFLLGSLDRGAPQPALTN